MVEDEDEVGRLHGCTARRVSPGQVAEVDQPARSHQALEGDLDEFGRSGHQTEDLAGEDRGENSVSDGSLPSHG